ncbi:MAG: ABC transporter ATP-binding protein [Planctomycetes bacterium]|jgi:iron complex transport system ATP-binding protein|nr:ABC transporter ATP-binding protein [Planctomycetota bacterium]
MSDETPPNADGVPPDVPPSEPAAESPASARTTEHLPAATEVGAPRDTAPALVITGLTIWRGSRVVLDDVSVSVAMGQVTALIGPNGAGKSTLINAALGLVPCDHGRIHLLGQDLLRLDRRARARLIGYVPQRSRLSAPLPVREVVALGRYALSGGLSGIFGANRRAVDAALAAVDATALAERRFNELSAGEAQRVLVARALAGGAQTLLLDEPTAALDIGHALSLLALLRRLAANGCTVLVALHQLDEVRRVADHAVLLNQGRVAITGTPDAVMTSAHLTAAFGVEPDPAGALAFRLSEPRTQPVESP